MVLVLTAILRALLVPLYNGNMAGSKLCWASHSDNPMSGLSLMIR